MEIDNVSYDGQTITSQVHGYTFTHGQDCNIVTAWRGGGKFTDACDCFLSRVEITEINGTPVAQLKQEQRPWWKPRWSYPSFAAGVVFSYLWDLWEWLVPYA